MAGFIQNIIWNSVEGFVEAGTRTAGEYAGNALIKAGDLLENGGRGVGNSIERSATKYGSSISGQTYQSSAKPLPSTARKPVVKRSNSLPASSKLSSASAAGGGGGSRNATSGHRANKKPNANLAGTVGTTVAKTTASRSIPPPRPFSAAATNNLPKPSYKGTGYPSSDKKTAVKAGQPRPFVPPVGGKKTGGGGGGNAAKKAYPGVGTGAGISTGIGAINKTASKSKLPPPRLGPQIAQGQKMHHLAI